jgi:hypothetical protein
MIRPLICGPRWPGKSEDLSEAEVALCSGLACGFSPKEKVKCSGGVRPEVFGVVLLCKLMNQVMALYSYFYTCVDSIWSEL